MPRLKLYLKKNRPLCKVCERNREGVDIELDRQTVNGRVGFPRAALR
jgi:hypothetical protein